MKLQYTTSSRRRSLVCILWILVVVVLTSIQVSWAKEVEVTKEWTLLGENDTVPVGAHIRMDLSTGKKWVKLLEEDDSASAQVEASGMVAVSNEENAQKTAPKMDFDMMHRTLSYLPQEEQERMGLPPKVDDSASPEEREAFELQMKTIWFERQALLKQWEEEILLDLPQILKDRIQSIQDYLNDPGDDTRTKDLFFVLEDLEFQLTDVDMTRDFHTLGGWPLLVSLLSPDVHIAANQTKSSTNTKDMEKIQGLAAWTIGTAVKNTEEFATYALEEFQLTVGDSAAKVCALDLLQDHLVETTNDWKLQKVLYAVSSILRGNRSAQTHWCAIGAVKRLEDLMAVETTSIKNRKRLLTLVQDIVADVQFHPGKSPQVDTAIIQSFTTPGWCQATMDLLRAVESLQETALQTVVTMASHCVGWTDPKYKEQLQGLKTAWQSIKAGLDPNHQQERLELVGSALEALEEGAQKEIRK